MTGALDGVRVIDFGQYIAAPLAAMLLADQGADVVRIDPPSGPLWDTPANATWNRGKRSIALDLKQPADLDTARRLVGAADVLVENFRPGVMDRIGLGADALMEANPRLIYCSLPGFAADDPRSGVPAWEGVVGAATGSYRGRPDADAAAPPPYTAIPVPSVYAAIQGAVSVTMALNAREREGVGQRIEMPLFEAMFGAIGFHGLRIHDGRPPRFDIGGTWTRAFECKDGRWVWFQSGNQNFREFVEAAGITSWDDEGLTDRARLREDRDLAAEQTRRIIELFTKRTAQEWEDLVGVAGSECAICRTSAEWLVHPHARESGMIVAVDDPQYGEMLQPGIIARMSGTPGAVRAPAPALDAHRDELVAELDGTAPAPSAESTGVTLRAALEGVRVLDLCIVLAGPTCGRTLAEFGADVVKIDNPARGPIAFHNDINRAKRSILLDLKSEAGLDVFWRLLEAADVVVQNYRKGAAERLGISYEQVRRRKPDIVYASLNSYGYEGPWSTRPGHEQLAQAATGMQERFGGDGPPRLQTFAVNDYGTGFAGAYAVALALLHRQRTGEGQHVDTSLAHTACTLQSPFLQQYEGKTWEEPRGQSALGDGPLHRAYAASDGWLFIGARERDLPRLAAVEGLAGVDRLSGDGLAAELEARFEGATAADWVERLSAAGIGAHRVVTDMREVTEDPWVQARGLSIVREHEDFGMITTTGPGPRLSRTPVQPGRPAPKPGSDALDILREVGLDGEFEQLVEQGAVVVEGVGAR